MDTGEAGRTLSRRAFVIQVGAATALLGTAMPGQAQTGAAAVPGKVRLIVRSPRPINLEAPFAELTSEVTPYELFFVRNNHDRRIVAAGGETTWLTPPRRSATGGGTAAIRRTVVTAKIDRERPFLESLEGTRIVTSWGGVAP